MKRSEPPITHWYHVIYKDGQLKVKRTLFDKCDDSVASFKTKPEADKFVEDNKTEHL